MHKHSWHLSNHQNQEHSSDIRGSNFALTRRIKIHPDQLIDRRKKLRASSSSNALVTIDADVSGGSNAIGRRLSVKEKQQINNEVYSRKNVSVSSTAAPGGLPPLTATPSGGSDGGIGDMRGSMHSDSLLSNSAARGSNTNTHFDERTLNPTLGHPRPGEPGYGGNVTKNDAAGKKTSQYDDVVVIQARKWAEGQRLAELRVHTEKLREWRRSIEVQLHREARPLPKGKWNRRTKEKYIPACAKQETV